MAIFAIRVELHGADSGDYDRLHKAMSNAGFSREVEVNGVKLQLPTGEYRRVNSGSETATGICALVGEIAAQIKPKPAVCVDETASTAVLGLRPVNALASLYPSLVAVEVRRSLGIL